MALTYKKAGVDVDAGQHFVKEIKKIVKKSHGKEVISGIGGFAALFEAPFSKYKKPILVSGTDGVGTKIHLAMELNSHSGIGQDLVAMCLNDILTTGARPLFFLDYLVTKKLDKKVHLEVIKSIAKACQKSGLALIGGETAEHPNGSKKGDYDLAGFAVGVVESKKILPQKNIFPGDILIGYPSSGIHSNGFSLIRKIIKQKKLNLKKTYPGMKKSLGGTLLTPTMLYSDILPRLNSQDMIKAACHITGGGFYENIPRMLPKNTIAKVQLDNIPQNPIFPFLEKSGPVEKREMYSTFNMGCGLVMVLDKKRLTKVLKMFPKAFVLGNIEKSRNKEPGIIIESIDY